MPAALDHLKKRSEFLAVAGTNRRYTTPGLVLQARPISNDDRQVEAEGAKACPARTAVRVGFTATKKLGNAVIRNRAKRRLREAARLVLAERTADGAELVLVARRETGDMDFAALRQNLAQALDEVLP